MCFLSSVDVVYLVIIFSVSARLGVVAVEERSEVDKEDQEELRIKIV
jgi:hypothetical protein